VRSKGLVRIPYCRETWYFLDIPEIGRVYSLRLNPRGCYRSAGGILRIQMKKMTEPLGSCLTILKDKFDAGDFEERLRATVLAWAFVDHVNHIDELGIKEPFSNSKGWLHKIEAKYGKIPRTVTTPTLQVVQPNEHNRIYRGEVKLWNKEKLMLTWRMK